MDPTNEPRSPESPRVIETASATTSSSNASSGPFAYIIALVALGACALMGLATGGCVRFASELVSEEVVSTIAEPEDEEFGFGEPMSDTNLIPHGSNQQYSLEEVLDTDLTLYTSIDSLLAASAYANAQPGVSSFVREVVLIDRNATNEMSETLRTAAWGNADMTEALDEAKAKAEETLQALRDTTLPTVTGDDADDISNSLEKARSETIARWEAISSELETLSSGESFSESQVKEADTPVSDATSNAAGFFEEALSSSRYL